MPIGNIANTFTNGAGSTHLPTFTIKVAGKQLPVEYGIVQINIENSTHAIPTAQILLEDGNAASQTFEISSSSDLVPGKELEILGGYSGNENTIFKGIITRQRLKMNRRGGAYLQVECKDSLFRSTLSRKSRYFKDVSDANIFEDILNEYEGVSLDFSLTGGVSQHKEIVQYQVSDWDFMMMRAEKNGFYCTANQGTLSVKKLPPAAVPVFSLEYGRDIIDMDLEMDARNQIESVEASSWDGKNQEMVTGEMEDLSTPGLGNISGKKLSEVSKARINLQHTGQLTQQELDQWAEGQMLKSRMSKVRGTIKIQGNHLAEPGTFVDLGGLGDRFNGTAFISGIQHNFGQGQWITTIQVGFSPEWHFQKYNTSQYPASGFAAAINGLQIGIVTQLEGDPDGHDRIKVKLPVINAGDDGTWARLSTVDAGDNRGFVWRPEINDEVVVGFLNDDPNQPIILGSLFSVTHPSPIAAADDNFEKGWTTKSEIKIRINDEKKTIEISTPNDNKILLSDEDGGLVFSDESGNKITLNSDGISLESTGDIVMKASADIKIEGTNVEINANAGFKANGSSTAELSGGGQTTIKGGIVNIN